MLLGDSQSNSMSLDAGEGDGQPRGKRPQRPGTIDKPTNLGNLAPYGPVTRHQRRVSQSPDSQSKRCSTTHKTSALKPFKRVE